MGASEQQEPIMHQGFPLFVGEAFALDAMIVLDIRKEQGKD
jgi:hypothetical protein